MTEEQNKHVQTIASEFASLMSSKYEKGVKEHGGNLWEVGIHDMVDMALDEAIDQVVYLMTLKEQVHGKYPR